MSQLNGDLLISSIQNNTNLAIDFMTTTINAESARNSIVSVNLFYQSLSYTQSDEDEACDWICLLANIGGTLGLFMGAGVLSLGEIVEVLMEFIFLFKDSSVNVKH